MSNFRYNQIEFLFNTVLKLRRFLRWVGKPIWTANYRNYATKYILGIIIVSTPPLLPADKFFIKNIFFLAQGEKCTHIEI